MLTHKEMVFKYCNTSTKGLTAPGNVQNPPVVDSSYFDSQQRVTNEPPKFDWNSRRRGFHKLRVIVVLNESQIIVSSSGSDAQEPVYRRTQYRRPNTTRTSSRSYPRRYESLYNTSDSQTQTRPHSISSSIDALLGNQSSPDYRGGSYTYQTRRYNTSVGSSRSGTINGQQFQTPILWQNRTWHWSTNRTRDYDPDLDGTTLPPPYETGRQEEDWDGTDLVSSPIDNRHPMGRQVKH